MFAIFYSIFECYMGIHYKFIYNQDKIALISVVGNEISLNRKREGSSFTEDEGQV